MQDAGELCRRAGQHARPRAQFSRHAGWHMPAPSCSMSISCCTSARLVPGTCGWRPSGRPGDAADGLSLAGSHNEPACGVHAADLQAAAPGRQHMRLPADVLTIIAAAAAAAACAAAAAAVAAATADRTEPLATLPVVLLAAEG